MNVPPSRPWQLYKNPVAVILDVHQTEHCHEFALDDDGCGERLPPAPYTARLVFFTYFAQKVNFHLSLYLKKKNLGLSCAKLSKALDRYFLATS